MEGDMIHPFRSDGRKYDPMDGSHGSYEGGYDPDEIERDVRDG